MAPEEKSPANTVAVLGQHRLWDPFPPQELRRSSITPSCCWWGLLFPAGAWEHLSLVNSRCILTGVRLRSESLELCRPSKQGLLPVSHAKPSAAMAARAVSGGRGCGYCLSSPAAV